VYTWGRGGLHGPDPSAGANVEYFLWAVCQLHPNLSLLSM